MRSSRIAVGLFLAVLCVPGMRAQEKTPLPAVKAVRFGKLWDGKGKVWTNAIVIVEGERIRTVTTDAAAIPVGAEVIDLTKYTGIPGLIDVHTHMTYYWDRAPGTNPWVQKAGRMPAVAVFLAQENALKTLQAGVTTVRDLGAQEYNDIAMRDLINMGAMPGPRMFVCGYALEISWRLIRPGYARPTGGQADGVAEVMRVVREQIYGAGADVVKMFGADVVGSESFRQTFTFEEIKAAVEVTHQAGKRIAIHAQGPSATRDAVRAGVDSVEHGDAIEDATLAEMARRGTFFVPTIDHLRYFAEHSELFGYPPDEIKAGIGRQVEAVIRAHKAGVRLAMGSDAAFTQFGENTRELGWFVKAGMTPEQALETATVNGAALLGKEKELGAVAPGYFADMVAVEGDPLADINVVLDNVRWVMKGGAVIVDKMKPAPAH